ncbi:MAG TPA: hypothetical protein VHL08_09415 [Dongiaceae bacterium]|jgi:hypothetical protein|nr:hypothetical protein [Dongiaceae bacterium]
MNVEVHIIIFSWQMNTTASNARQSTFVVGKNIFDFNRQLLAFSVAVCQWVRRIRGSSV